MTLKNDIKNKALRAGRLSRDDWLEQSLGFFARSGRSKVNIDELVKELGVTKGSFYHHFTGREDFVSALVHYWDERYTRNTGATIIESDAPPEEMLWQLMLTIEENRYGLLDVPVRTWAAQDAEIRKVVANTDKFRLNIVRKIFMKMGFEGEMLEARARAFVTTVSMELAVCSQLPRSRRPAYLEALHAFFVHGGAGDSRRQ